MTLYRIIACNFARLIFTQARLSESILTMKYSRFTVYDMYKYIYNVILILYTTYCVLE